jgi:hypothetical protein
LQNPYFHFAAYWVFAQHHSGSTAPDLQLGDTSFKLGWALAVLMEDSHDFPIPPSKFRDIASVRLLLLPSYPFQFIVHE